MAVTISIIIPALNEEVCLPRLLADISRQTHPIHEVILVDGKSEDRTLSRAALYKDKCNLRVVTSEKRNLSFQRNLGAQNASGEYILFLDADMRLHNKFIAKLAHAIEKSRYLIYLPIHIPDTRNKQDILMYKVLAFFSEVSNLTHKPFSYGPSAVFQRTFFSHLGGYYENAFVYEDHEIVQRARKQGVLAKLLPTIGVRFSMRRFLKEGRFAVLQKYLIANMHFLAHGKIDKEIFAYDMGGKAKYLLSTKKSKGLGFRVQESFDKLMLFFEK